MYLGTEVGGEERDHRPQDQKANGQECEPEPFARVEPGAGKRSEWSGAGVQ